ncbi:MAG: hypothetical protein ACXVZR_04820 [Terriglobales bacterium]
MENLSQRAEFADTALEGGGPRLQRLWLSMLTRRLWLIAGTIGLMMFLGSVGLDVLLLEHEAGVGMVVSNALVALLAASLVYTLLAFGRTQRRRVIERMDALQEVNHHIRNALQALSFTAGTMKNTKEGDTINEAIQRIQWALHEVLPKVEPEFEPFQGSAREAHDALRRDDES